MNKIKEFIDTAMGKKKCDLVLKNAQIIDIFNNEIVFGNLGIKENIIIGIGNYKGDKYIDLKNQYICPGFIDSHVHIESSLVVPPLFAKNIIPKGTTTIIADPHEIANICGLEGINFFLESTKHLPLDVFIMLPSCVPSTDFETSGSFLKANDLRKLINHPRVKGLGEVMDYVSLIENKKEIIDKIKIAKEKIIDGHVSNLFGKRLNSYAISGIKTNHECTTPEEMITQIRSGFYIQMRQGTITKDVEKLLPALNKNNLRRCLFCSDDKHPEKITEKGHINENINLAIKNGIEVIDAIKIATINAAECYNLKRKGAIAPGYDADLVVFKNLKKIMPTLVFKKGILVAKKGKSIFKINYTIPKSFLSKINIKNITKKDLKLILKKNYVNVIKILNNSVITKKVTRKIDLINNEFYKNPLIDICKIIVIERYTGKSSFSIGLVEGFKIKKGAIASTIAHDSHNLIVVGDNDNDILNCIKRIKKNSGGIVVSSNKKIIGELKLDIAGIMSNENLEIVSKKMQNLSKIVKKITKEKIDPFMLLAFMALPVIPELKITDKGLFDVNLFKFISIEK